jgi:hypothetical protein
MKTKPTTTEGNPTGLTHARTTQEMTTNGKTTQDKRTQEKTK